MAQYDPQTIQAGIAKSLGADTLHAERESVAGLNTSAPATWDACQVSATLTVQKAVNTSTTPVIGIYDGVSGSVVRSGIVQANRSGPAWADGDVVYLSSTAGKLTKIKPTKDVLHEVGVVVDAGTSKVLLQPRPVLTLPASPPLSLWFASYPGLYQVASPSGGVIRSITLPSTPGHLSWDGNYLWAATTGNPATVWKIDPYTGNVVGTYSLGYTFSSAGNNWLVSDGTNHWIIGGSDRYVKFDDGGNVLATVTGLGSGYYEPTGAAYDGNGGLWIGRANTREVRRIDVNTNAVTLYASCLDVNHFPRSGNGGCCADGYFYLQTQVNYFSPVYYYVSKIRCSDGALMWTHQIGTDIGSAYGDIVTDGTYLYVETSYVNVLKLRISDQNHEWENNYQVNGAFALDGSGYLWSPDGNWMSQGVYYRIQCSDGAAASWNPMGYGSNPCARSSGVLR